MGNHGTFAQMPKSAFLNQATVHLLLAKTPFLHDRILSNTRGRIYLYVYVLSDYITNTGAKYKISMM